MSSKLKPSTFFLIGTVIHLLITSSFSKQTDVQPKTIEGLCDYYYDGYRYTCSLHNAVISSPDEVLVIVGNHLPEQTDSDVQVVIHRNVSISYFNGEILEKFINLEYLAIGAADLLQISENAFDVRGKLDHLYIGFNPLLRTLPPSMLQNCVKLRYLDLYYNGVTLIPEDLFGVTTNLEIFEAISNQLTSLPPNLLRNMINLKQFSIRSNSIANIDRNLLVYATNLQTVDLTNNPILDNSVITNLLNGHVNLKSIRIRSNSFTSFDFTFFSQFTQLNDIEIGSNSLTGIDWNGLPTSLTSIYVSNIGEEIPADAFNHLTNLESLGFTGTGVTVLHENTFKQLVNLKSLSIQLTGIRTIPSKIFVNQANVTQLYLSYNNIEELPEGVFASLVNLGFNSSALGNNLVLSGNRIRRLNANSFGYHRYLKNLVLAFNEIAEIEREIFARFPNPMDTVDLTWNNCTDAFFWYESDLDSSSKLEDCFNNWAGITTTVAPGAAFQFKAEFTLLLIPFIFNLFFHLS